MPRAKLYVSASGMNISDLFTYGINQFTDSGSFLVSLFKYFVTDKYLGNIKKMWYKC